MHALGWRGRRGRRGRSKYAVKSDCESADTWPPDNPANLHLMYAYAAIAAVPSRRVPNYARLISRHYNLYAPRAPVAYDPARPARQIGSDGLRARTRLLPSFDSSGRTKRRETSLGGSWSFAHILTARSLTARSLDVPRRRSTRREILHAVTKPFSPYPLPSSSFFLSSNPRQAASIDARMDSLLLDPNPCESFPQIFRESDNSDISATTRSFPVPPGGKPRAEYRKRRREGPRYRRDVVGIMQRSTW